MLPDILNISILFGVGGTDPEITGLVENLPSVRVVGQAQDPADILGFGPNQTAPDLVLVYMEGDDSLPGWLETLTSGLPQTAVLLCSRRIEPDFLLSAMRLGVREVVPLPLNPQDLEQALERIRISRRRLSEATGAAGRILTVTGNKGGVGITSVAVNLAVALARVQSGKVALVDLGRPYPDVGHFLDRESTYTIFDLILNQANLDQAFLEKTIQPYEKNLALVHGVADFTDQDNLSLEGLRKVMTILKAHYRWVVVDLSHWLDELFLQVVQDSDLVLMLMTLTVPDLRNLGHLWPLLRNFLPVQEKVKLVVNRFDRSNGLTLGNVEQVLKQKAFYTLPSDHQHLVEAINRGVPLASVAPKSKLWLSLENLAQQLVNQPQAGDGAGVEKPRRRFWVF
ncbi:MAG: AAA family ATPase [Desulfobaccales bacterium]